MSTILVIDDEPGIRTVLRDVLQDEEYDVFLAEDGYEGLNDADRDAGNTDRYDLENPPHGCDQKEGKRRLALSRELEAFSNRIDGIGKRRRKIDECEEAEP